MPLKSTINGIFNKVQLLEQHPQLGHCYEVETSREIRILLYGHYRIAYLIRPDDTIDVLGVFHGALNIGAVSHLSRRRFFASRSAGLFGVIG